MDIHFRADSSDKAGEIPHIRQSKQDTSMTDNSCSLLTFVPGGLACRAFSGPLCGVFWEGLMIYFLMTFVLFGGRGWVHIAVFDSSCLPIWSVLKMP